MIQYKLTVHDSLFDTWDEINEPAKNGWEVDKMAERDWKIFLLWKRSV